LTASGTDCLSAALEAYFTLLDQGQQPDPEEYLRRFPECADELRHVFVDLAFLKSRIAQEGGPGAAGDMAAHQRSDSFTRESGLSDDPSSASGQIPAEFRSGSLPRIRGYDVLDELGSGSQGVVYKAKQLSTRRLVALKVVRHGAFASGADRRRFENEVQLASRLRHANIVAVYDCGCDSGRDFFAMEYVEGEPLDLYCSRRDLVVGDTVRLFLKVCRTVSYAHQQGVIHRDLKPSNVLVDSSGEPHILDFGLAKPVPGSPSLVDSTLTHVGDFAGTWSYASPEQVRVDPARVDVRSDVYTLGVILYEMLTDCSPYPAPTISRESISRHILKTPPLPPSSILREIDPDLEAVVLHALHKDPDRRYQSAAAFADDLDRYLKGEIIEARRSQSWYVLFRLLRRHRWQVGGFVAGLVILIAFTVTVSILYSRELVARETANLRMNLVRDAQDYTLGKLDDLQRISNRYWAVLERNERFRETPLPTEHEIDWSELDSGLADLEKSGALPRELNKPEELMAPVVQEWLARHDDRLTEITALLDGGVVVFALEAGEGDGSTFDQRPLGMERAKLLSFILIARTLQKNDADHSADAIASLDAARRIALGLGDGRLLDQKWTACCIRRELCEAVLRIFEERVDDPATAKSFADWAMSDPPAPNLRLGMISERGRLVHAIIGASLSSPRKPTGHLDLDLLDTLTYGLVEASGALTEEDRRTAASVSSVGALAAIEDYVREVETWDDLSIIALETKARQTNDRLKENQAWHVLRILLPHHHGMFKEKVRCSSVRSLMILVAGVFQFRLSEGRWPANLAEMEKPDVPLKRMDPSTGSAYGLALAEGRPTISVRKPVAGQGAEPRPADEAVALFGRE